MPMFYTKLFPPYWLPSVQPMPHTCSTLLTAPCSLNTHVYPCMALHLFPTTACPVLTRCSCLTLHLFQLTDCPVLTWCPCLTQHLFPLTDCPVLTQCLCLAIHLFLLINCTVLTKCPCLALHFIRKFPMQWKREMTFGCERKRMKKRKVFSRNTAILGLISTNLLH